MRPLLLITKLDAGGMERFCSTLCNVWVTQGRSATLCALHPAAAGMSRTWLSEGVEYVELRRPARYAAPALARLCRRRPAEPVLVLGLEIAAVLLLLRRLRLIRNPIAYRESTAVTAHYRGVWRGILRAVVGGVDGLLVQSRQALDDLGRLGRIGGMARVIWNPCGIPLPVTAPVFAVPPRGPALRLLCVGRLEPVKGHARLLACMPSLQRRFPGVRLRIAGQGSLQHELERQIRDLGLSGAVDLAGFVHRPQAMYADADILVLPSFYEGLPNVAIEALASGCRLVAAAGAGGTREFMAALGLGEFLVPSDTFAAGLEDAVARACESPASVWQQAWTTLAERVRPEAAAGHVWQFLDEVAASCAR